MKLTENEVSTISLTDESDRTKYQHRTELDKMKLFYPSVVHIARSKTV
jgi:hypothetical protein